MSKCKGILGWLFGHRMVTVFETTTTPPTNNVELRKTLDNLKEIEPTLAYINAKHGLSQQRVMRFLKGKVERKAVSTYCKRCGLKIES